MPVMDEQTERAATGLLALHEKMLAAVKANRPYPVSIRLGESDTDAVLNGAVALENTRAAHSVIAGKVAELIEAAEMVGLAEPIAHLRDRDGTGSLHICAKGDPGCFPVFAQGKVARLTEALVAARVLVIEGSDPRTRNELLTAALTTIDAALAPYPERTK